ncbi:MAG: dTMP kinase [Planctomycetota bacterium]
MTQAKALAQWLRERGVPTELFRDPGGTAIGEKIRQILLDSENTAMGAPTEVLLYMAARAQLLAEKISPALNNNKCVVLDRWLSSTCAYQGYAGGFGMDKVIDIAQDCLERVWPDLTIILDVDLEAAAKRLNRPLDRMEKKGDGYHQQVREGFLRLAKSRDDFCIVEGSDDVETVHGKVLEVLAQADLK